MSTTHFREQFKKNNFLDLGFLIIAIVDRRVLSALSKRIETVTN